MPIRRQTDDRAPAGGSTLWPAGGRHLWSAGQASAPHAHDRGHLVYAARGVLSVHTGPGISVVPTNRVAWIPAGVEHHHRSHTATDLRILFLPPSLGRLLPDHPVVLAADPLARELLLTLTGPRGSESAEAYDRGPLARLRRVLVDELQVTREQPLHLPEPQDDRLRAVARRLRNHPGDSASLAELGRAGGASARTLSRLFQRELGLTFYQWRTQLRLFHALVLLADGHDVSHVAHACGWSNPSTFIAAFTDVVGTTPGRYRREGVAS